MTRKIDPNEILFGRSQGNDLTPGEFYHHCLALVRLGKPRPKKNEAKQIFEKVEREDD